MHLDDGPKQMTFEIFNTLHFLYLMKTSIRILKEPKEVLISTGSLCRMTHVIALN